VKRQIYLDYASTTPLDARVFQHLKPFLFHKFGNPSTLYKMGREAREAIMVARLEIAAVLNCFPEEIVFTGSATEADNLAVVGAARGNRHQGNKIIVSSVEHKGIMAVCDSLKKEGFEIYQIPVNKYGVIDLKSLRNFIDNNTLLVSIIYADSETGTIQPIKEAYKIINEFRNKRGADIKSHQHRWPYLHVDASQAAQFLDLDVKCLGADLLTLSSHKIYGPKGVGCLYIKNGINIEPLIYGGGQQNQIRSGTENVPALVGFGKALTIARKERAAEYHRLGNLRDRLEKGIIKSIPKVVINGYPKNRLPNFLNISILDIEGEALTLYLDKFGIYINTGSACDSESLEPSHILKAHGRPYEFIHGSLRFSLGKSTTRKDIDNVLKILPPLVKKLRLMSPLNLSMKQTGSEVCPRV